MKLNQFFILLFGTATLTLHSCYYDKFDEIHPEATLVNPCDTALADTYTGSINAIMQINCVGCHSSAAPTQNVALDTYNGVKAAGANGSLTGTMTGAGGYSSMPPSIKAQQCEIDRIQRWVNAGMPE